MKKEYLTNKQLAYGVRAILHDIKWSTMTIWDLANARPHFINMVYFRQNLFFSYTIILDIYKRKEKAIMRSKNFGSKIKALRIYNHMTQSFAASKLGVSQSTICGWESGSVPIYNKSLLNNIAELYKCPVNQLLSDIQEDASEDVISIDHLTREQREIVTKIIHQFEILNKKKG